MDWDPITDEMYWAESYDDEITIRKGKMRPPYHEVYLYRSGPENLVFRKFSFL